MEVRYGERLRSQDAYHAMHRMSLEEPDDFWVSLLFSRVRGVGAAGRRMQRQRGPHPWIAQAGIAEAFHWKRKWAGPVCEYNYDTSKGPIFIKWFQGAQTNVCYNALDRSGPTAARILPAPLAAPRIREPEARCGTQTRRGGQGRPGGLLFRGQRAGAVAHQ